MKDKALPKYEALVWEYRDRVVGNMTCNLCGEKFSVTLTANPAAIKALGQQMKVNRLFVIADRRHTCHDEVYEADPAETDRIVNVYHETKRRLVRAGKGGLLDSAGKRLTTRK